MKRLLVLGAVFFGLAGRAAAEPLAASVVRSKEWKMRRSPVKEEEFVGDVRYWTLSRFVRADWALYRHAEESWQARGDIRAEHTLPDGRGVLEVLGEQASFDQKRRKGVMTGKKDFVDIVLTGPSGLKDHGRSGRLVWELDKRASLLGGVHLWGERVEAWADRADYEWSDATLTMAGGRPVLHKLFGDWTAALTADVIRATEDPHPGAAASGLAAGPAAPAPGSRSALASPAGVGSRHLWAQGRVEGWLHFDNTKAVPSLEP
ncbi:MAG: hypothetical protein HY927_14090 [Elusimicrobia bacterium]|nr:hypothetical protein [Elusimicrobiota bacterium]